MPYQYHFLEDSHKDYGDEVDHHHPKVPKDYFRKGSMNEMGKVQWKSPKRCQHINQKRGRSVAMHVSEREKRKHYTFCKLSPLPNGECSGELLLVYVLGLVAPEEIPSLLDSVLHFRW